MLRRTLLQALPLLPAVAAPKLAALEFFVVKVNRRGNWVTAQVRTAGGLTGIGDASQSGNDAACMAHARQFFERAQALGIFGIEPLRSEIHAGGRPAAVAFSALEQCFWDIRGKLAGVPLCDLLGGRLRQSVRNYANINRAVDDRTPTGFAAVAERAVRAGFDALKLAPFDGMPPHLTAEADIERYARLGLDCAAAVRQAIGPDRDLLVDVHSHFDLRHGLELVRRFEPLRLFWIEEVTPATADLAAINRAAPMRTAGGESLFGVRGFYPYIAAGAVRVVMPDIKYCGGLLEAKEIAAMAEGAGLLAAPHDPASPVGNIASAHLCAGLANFLILEHAFGEVPWRAELIDPPEAFERGRLALSTRPGLGISLNQKTVAKYRF